MSRVSIGSRAAGFNVLSPAITAYYYISRNMQALFYVAAAFALRFLRDTNRLYQGND